MRRLLFVALAMSGHLVATVAPADAQDLEAIQVVVEPGEASVEVGVEVDFTVTVTNRGDTPSTELAVHVDVTSPTRSGSVDPEDWTDTLTRRVGVVDPGQSRSIDWTVKPISSGTFTFYAVALPESGAADVWPSNGVRIAVDQRRTLNPEGVLPVAIAGPVVVGGLLLTRIRRSARRS